jgi:hypothetical protein
MRTVRPEVIAVAAILAMSCGKAKVRQIDRYTVTVDKNDAGLLVAHRDDCPTSTMEVRYEDADAACYGALAAGQQLDVTHVTYRHNLADCGREGPGSSIASCRVDHVGWSWSGTSCPP